jgi:hypothetical protein
MTWRKQFLSNLATFCLMAAMFFNPLGFDVLFKLIMTLTGSYWITDLLFYLAAGLFLGLYFLLRSKVNKSQ